MMKVKFVRLMVSMLAGLLPALGPTALANRASVIRYHVSPEGNDAWSGQLAAPNPAGTDGPFATPGQALLAVRARIAQGLDADLRVELQGGD